MFFRRLLSLAVTLLVLLPLLAACGRETPATDQPATVTVDDLPAAIGRGYPLGSVAASAGDTSIAIGDRAPNFRLTLDDGRSLTLHDLAGRPILINFWATWCGPCRIEMPDLVRTATTTPDLVLLAVNVQEGLEVIEPFAADFAMEVPVVRDADGAIQNLYQVRGMPTTYFVDRDGKIRAVWAGVLTPARLATLLEEIL